MSKSTPKIAFHASIKPKAQEALEELEKLYDTVEPADADVIVAIGGDGGMLRALHQYADYGIPIFGLNTGRLGFLLNDYKTDGLLERIQNAKSFTIHPLRMLATDVHGKKHDEIAFNEVSLLRETHNSAHLTISIDHHVRMDHMVCDGIILSTAVGSTAYNSSAGGPIVPLDANVLPLTPISVFRPRRWAGALISQESEVQIDVITPEERTVSVTADSKEIRDIKTVKIRESRSVTCTLLFDPDKDLGERIYAEQFAD